MKRVTCCGLALCLWVSLLLTGVGAVTAQQSVVDLSLNPNLPQRFLLLRNGAVFAGRIDATNGRYAVQIDPQTTINLDANRVWVLADSMQELFEFRRARVLAYDSEAQFELWQWCLQNDLLTPVAEALPTMRKAGVHESQIRSLELGLARARGELPVPALHVPPTKAARTETPAPVSQRPGLQSPTIQATSAGASRDATTSGPSAPVINSVFSFYDQPGFNNDNRIQEAIATSIKQTAVDQFNESVHWALVQACAGCHYPENQGLHRESGFALEIPSGPNKATLEQTRHNLEQLRPLLNRDNPGNSRLLALIAAPHGGQKSPPLAADSTEFRQITQWVYRSGAHQAGTSDESRVTVASAMEFDIAPPAMAGPTTPPPTPLPLLPAKGPQVDPQRPYDPTPFNRHFHPGDAHQTSLPTRPATVETPVPSNPTNPVEIPLREADLPIRPPSTLPRIPRR